MKKLLILAVLLIGCSTLQAQDWKDALSKAATSAADKVTGGKLTQMAITGRWEYSGPGVKFESDDTLSELGGSALSSSVEKKLDGAFEALLGTHSLNGTYEFNPETHAITLHFSKAPGKLGSLTGHAYLSGSQMQLVFPSEKLMELLSGIGAKIASLQPLTASLEKYKSIAIGFNFSK